MHMILSMMSKVAVMSILLTSMWSFMRPGKFACAEEETWQCSQPQMNIEFLPTVIGSRMTHVSTDFKCEGLVKR